MKSIGKAGKLGTGTISAMILGLVLVVVLFQMAATLVPEAQTAGDTLNESGVPLGGLFVSGGVIFIIIMAGLLLVVVNHFIKGGRK